MRKLNFLRKTLIDKNLAYLLGAMKDGSLPVPSKNKFEVTFACDFCRDWLTSVIAPKLCETFKIASEKVKIYKEWSHKSKQPFFRAKVYSKELHRNLAEFYPPGDQRNWCTPVAIKDSGFEIQREYIRGFYDAEGGCRDVESFLNGKTKTLNCELVIACKHGRSPNEPLTFIKQNLERLGIKVHLRKTEDGLTITGKQNVLKFYKNFMPLHPRKRIMLEKLLRYKGVLASAEA